MTTREICYETMVNVGGGVFLGVNGEGLVLFAGRRESDPILSIRPDELSADAVRRAIAAKYAQEDAEVLVAL